MAIKKFRQQLALGLAVMMAAGSVPVVTHAEEVTSVSEEAPPQNNADENIATIGETPTNAATWDNAKTALVTELITKIGDGTIDPGSGTAGTLYPGGTDAETDATKVAAKKYANSIISYDGYDLANTLKWVTPEQREELINLIAEIIEDADDDLQDAMDEFDNIAQSGKLDDNSATKNALATEINEAIDILSGDKIVKVDDVADGTVGDYIKDTTTTVAKNAPTVVSGSEKFGNDIQKDKYWAEQSLIEEYVERLDDALELYGLSRDADGVITTGTTVPNIFDEASAEIALAKLEEQRDIIIDVREKADRDAYAEALGVTITNHATDPSDIAGIADNIGVHGLYDQVTLAKGLMGTPPASPALHNKYQGNYDKTIEAGTLSGLISSQTFTVGIVESKEGDGTDADGKYWLNTEDYQEYKNAIADANIVLENAITGLTSIEGYSTIEEIEEQARKLDKLNAKMILKVLTNGLGNDTLSDSSKTFSEQYKYLEKVLEQTEDAFKSRSLVVSELNGVDVRSGVYWAGQDDYDTMTEAYEQAKSFFNKVTSDDMEELLEVVESLKEKATTFFGDNFTVATGEILLDNVDGKVKQGTKEDVDKQRRYIDYAKEDTAHYFTETKVSEYEGVDVSENLYWVEATTIGKNAIEKLKDGFDNLTTAYNNKEANAGDLQGIVDEYNGKYNANNNTDTGLVSEFLAARSEGSKEDTDKARTELQLQYNKAKTGYSKISVASSGSGSEFTTATFWVSPSENRTFLSALEEADEILKDPASKEAEFNSAVVALEDAWNDLDNAAWDNYRAFQHSVHYKN